MKLLAYFACVGVLFTSFATFAEPSANHSSQSSKHSALALAHGGAGSAQVVSGIIAVPLVITGSVALSAGNASVVVADELVGFASQKTNVIKNKPLEVTEITITVDRSPSDVMQKKQ